MATSVGAAAPLRTDAWAPAAASVAAAPKADPNQRRIDAAIAKLRHTPSGREVADFLAANRVAIRVIPDSQFHSRHPGAGAVYDPRTNLITMPERALQSPNLVTTLAHEGKHAIDFADRPHWLLQSFALLGGTAKDGAAALVRLDNPVTAWLDSLTARQNEDEVNAYRLQAEVAQQLGRNESHWALGQASDGSPLPIEQIRERVATNDLYRMDPTRRLVLGAGLGFGITSLSAVGAQLVAGKLAPGSFLARHGWPVYTIGGALTAAWVVGDQLRARRLEAASAG